MHSRAIISVIAFSVIFLESVFAADAHMININVRESYSRILLSANLNGAFTEKIEEAFMSGMPVTFTYIIKLRRDRSAWWDATERSIKVHKVIKYDSFAKEFNAIEIVAAEPPKPEDFEKELEAIKERNRTTLYPGGIGPAGHPQKRYLTLKDMPRLKGWISSLKDVYIGDRVDLPANSRYYVEVKAVMDTIKLTPPFNYIFFFVTFLNFDTDWETSSPFIVERADAPIQNMVGQKKSK